MLNILYISVRVEGVAVKQLVHGPRKIRNIVMCTSHACICTDICVFMLSMAITCSETVLLIPYCRCTGPSLVPLGEPLGSVCLPKCQRERERERVRDYICSSHLGLIRWGIGAPQETETV
jgi:hypothetical protein